MQSLSGEMVQPMGQITLMVMMGGGDRVRTTHMTFLVVRAKSVYNIILGRTGILALGAVPSILHGAIRFPTPRGVVTMVTGSKVHVAEVRHDVGGPGQPKDKAKPMIK